MFYKVMLIANFDDLPPPNIFNGVRQYFSQHAQTINQGQENSEPSSITMQYCYHDEYPTRPCDLLWEEHTDP